MNKSLGELIHDCRKRMEQKQQTIANAVGKSAAWISEIETGKEVPSIELLLEIYEALGLSGDTHHESDIRLWLLKWLESGIKKHSGAGRQSGEAGLQKLISQLAERRKLKAIKATPTLVDFPDGFDNLVIICGDRREHPPKTRGDIFAESVSATDLMNIAQLIDRIGPVDIWSDKLFVHLNEDEIKREFGDNDLILLGSPAVNLASRAINSHFIFRFAVPDIAQTFDAELRKVSAINDRLRLEIFWKMSAAWQGEQRFVGIDIGKLSEEYATARVRREEIEQLAASVSQLLGQHTVKEIKNFFRLDGLVDTADAKTHGTVTRIDNDFGVVSLGPNPYDNSGKHSCILVAGIHGPGTYSALTLLLEDSFEEHPLGGVFEVHLDPLGAWITRLRNSRPQWQTQRYTIGKIISNLKKENQIDPSSTLKVEEKNRLIAFVERFGSNK